ncbi:hypothetical protein HPB47_007390 [Ixodes persulcatus]|uniref:Uncharacterized protein n=1 Tax=Ixodes persulcatus TaxID=34615 RepID=A0AC60P8F3_IXOPE|nr:hypothetical protein HPB47_007390 [Ixodes persulcatus]
MRSHGRTIGRQLYLGFDFYAAASVARYDSIRATFASVAENNRRIGGIISGHCQTVLHVRAVYASARSALVRRDRMFGAPFYTPEENAQRSERASDVKRDIENKSATKQKFDLLDVNFADVDGGAGTDFVVIDMAVLEGLFARTTCGECGMPVKLTKSARQYGLAVKLELSCTGCDLREARFSSPTVEGAANITPFEVNLRALQGIQSIGKGVTALSDFCAWMNLSHRGLHYKTFQGHLRKVVRVCESIAAASEAASVEVIKELYSDLLQAVNNIDVIFDGTWMTRGRSSHIRVGCIIEMYTGLVIDHVVLSNFCLGSALEPVFARLSDENLLERCSDRKTQNASECLHSVIWAQTSKNSHASLLSVTRAVAEAVAVFNQGRRETNESVASGLGYASGNCLARRSLEKDQQRLLKSNKVFSDSQATRKKLSKRHRLEKSDDYSLGQL